MFDIYIKNWKDSNGTLHTFGWDTVLSIPNADGSFPFIKPVIRNDETAADSLNFTMEMNSEYYDALIPFKTLIRVMYDGDCIFFGRVLTINKSTLFASKSVTCAGAAAFLNDTYYEGKQQKKLKKITTESYLEKLLDNHNTNTVEDWKKVYKGNITISQADLSDLKIHEPTSWSDTYSCLKTLTSNYGGHLYLRWHPTEEKLYLDWYDKFRMDYGDGHRCKVEVFKNILDINDSSETDNLFTVLIPTGGTNSKGNTIYLDGYVYTDKEGASHTHSGKFFPVELINDLYTDQELDRDFHRADDYHRAQSDFGKIFKTQSFSNATNKAKLWDYTKDWVKKNYYGILTSFTVKALDMHILGGDTNKILVGDVIELVYPVFEDGVKRLDTRVLVCKNISFDLYNPENNSYTFGIPSDLINKEYGTAKTTTSSTSSNSDTKKTAETLEEGSTVNFETVHDMILEFEGDYHGGTTAANSFWTNEEMSGTVMCYTSESDPVHDPSSVFPAQLLGKYTASNGKTYCVAMESSRGIFTYEDTNTSLKEIDFYYTQVKDLTYDTVEPIQTETKTGTVKFMKSNQDSTAGVSKTTAAFINANQNLFTIQGNGYEGASITANGNDSSITWYVNNNTGKESVKVSGSDSTITAKNSNNKETVKIDANSSSGGSCEFGNSAGGKTIKLDGNNKKITLNDTSGASSSNNTIEIDALTKKILAGLIDSGLVTKGIEINGSDDTLSIWGQGVQQTRGGTRDGGNSSTLKVKLNDTITYTDEDGNSQTKNGFITATDVSFPEMPSFKTAFLIVKNLIADYIEATVVKVGTSLWSDMITTNYLTVYDNRSTSYSSTKGEIRAVKYKVLIPGSVNVRDHNLEECLYNLSPSSGKYIGYRANGTSYDINLPETNHFNDASISGRTLSLKREDGTADKTVTLPDEFTDASISGTTLTLKRTSNKNAKTITIPDDYVSSMAFSESNGTITLTLTRNGGGTVTGSFNMASTQFYIDAVEAAEATGETEGRAGGWSDCYTEIGIDSTTLGPLNPGDSVDIYPTGKVTETSQTARIISQKLTISAATDNNLTAGNIKKNVTIFGVTGTYEGSGGSVTFRNVSRSTSETPQGYTRINVGSILELDEDYKSVCFETSDGGKYYIRINVTTDND